jgi:hypothetical protein
MLHGNAFVPFPATYQPLSTLLPQVHFQPRLAVLKKMHPSWRLKLLSPLIHTLTSILSTAKMPNKRNLQQVRLLNKQIRRSRVLIASQPEKLRKRVVQVVSTWINRNCSHRSSDVKVVNEKTVIYSDGSLEHYTPQVKVFCTLRTATAKVYIQRSVTEYKLCTHGNRRFSTITEQLGEYLNATDGLKPLPLYYVGCKQTPCFLVSHFYLIIPTLIS